MAVEEVFSEVEEGKEECEDEVEVFVCLLEEDVVEWRVLVVLVELVEGFLCFDCEEVVEEEEGGRVED